jgi:hypothetical protein
MDGLWFKTLKGSSIFELGGHNFSYYKGANSCVNTLVKLACDHADDSIVYEKCPAGKECGS